MLHMSMHGMNAAHEHVRMHAPAAHEKLCMLRAHIRNTHVYAAPNVPRMHAHVTNAHVFYRRRLRYLYQNLHGRATLLTFGCWSAASMRTTRRFLYSAAAGGAGAAGAAPAPLAP